MDLARKKEIIRYQLPEEAKDKRHKRFLAVRFWQVGETLSVLSTVENEPRLDVFDAASGAHKDGQVRHGVNTSRDWGGIVQIGGLLLIIDQAGLHAWAAAYGQKKPVRFLPYPS